MIGTSSGRTSIFSTSAMLTSGTLIGTHLCDPGTTRVGPLSSVMSSSMTIELTTRQSFGVTRGTSLWRSCWPSPLSGLRALSE